MKKFTKISMVTVSVTASLSMMLTGCDSSQGESNTASVKPVNGGTIHLTETGHWNDEFLPLLDSSTYTQGIYANSFDSLLNTDSKLNFIPWLMKSYTWSEDHKTITCVLQPNAKWSDGYPIISDDVLLYMNYMASKAYSTTFQGQYAYLVGTVKGAADIGNGKYTSFEQAGGFRKMNDKKFQIVFTQADGAALTNFVAGYTPLPAHILGSVPFSQWKDSSYDKMPTVVNGPFIPTQVNGNSSITYKANPLYWKGEPHIKNMVLSYVSSDIRASLIVGGKVDYGDVKSSDFIKLRHNRNLTTVVQPAMQFGYVGVNCTNPVFTDVRVRQAIEYAINRPAIIQGIDKGYGQIMNQSVPQFAWSAAPSSQINPYNYNPAVAKQLLDTAGMTVGSDGWRIDPKTGKKFVVHFDYPSDSQDDLLLAQEIQKDLIAIGLDVELNPPMDFTTLLTKDQNKDRSLQMWIMGTQLGSDPDPRGWWGSNDANNDTQFKSPEIDKLIYNTWVLPSDFTQAGRQVQFIAFNKYVNQELPRIFLDDADNLYLMNKKLHIPNYDWIPGYGASYIQDWWLSN